MRAAIFVNDPRVGVPITRIKLGQFFRFPASQQGKVYVLLSHDSTSRQYPFVTYAKLDDGQLYTSESDGTHKMVQPLQLVNAEFEVKGNG